MNPEKLAERIRVAQAYVGFDQTQNPRVQVALIPRATEWLIHFGELLRVDYLSSAGPLSSLLSDVAHEAYKMGLEDSPTAARSAALQAENERMRAAVMTAIATSPLDTTVTEMREDIVKALSQPALPHTCVLTATTVDGSVPLLCKACALAQPAPTDKP